MSAAPGARTDTGCTDGQTDRHGRRLNAQTTTQVNRIKNRRSKNERHCSESAPAPKKTSATLHGSVPAKKLSPKKAPPKTAQTI